MLESEVDMEVREAMEKDFIRIYELNHTALGYDYPVEKTWERLVMVMRRPTDRIFVACENDNVIGYVHAADYECIYADSMKNVLALAVDARYRNRGVGRALLTRVEEWAKECHCGSVRVVSGMHREDAHEFYLHCGYGEISGKKTFFKYF